jgi:LCP family protein required for cell wall assembly
VTLFLEFIVAVVIGVLLDAAWRLVRAGQRRLLQLGAIGIVLVVLAGLVGGYAYANHQFDKIAKVPVGADLKGHSGGTNYLLVGTDNRPGVQGDRSDTILVLRIAHGQSTMMSIPRDLFVTIPGMTGEHRINTAYNDGPASLLGAVQQTLGIPIDRYIEINFVSFAGVVDALGGVVINFPYPASDPKSGLNITQTGNVKLNGAEALAYVRSRTYTQVINGQTQVDGTADLGRVKRQQGFMRAVLKKAGASRNPFKLLKIGNALADGMKIDDHMTLLDAVHFAWNMGKLHPTSVVLPTTPYTTSGGSEVLKLQTAAAAPIIAQFQH